VARLGLQWCSVVWVGLAASCLLGPVGCTSEDDPDDTTQDASADMSLDTRADASVLPEGSPCVGGGDAARDGALGMALVQQFNCARCHQDEPVDAGLFLSGRLTSLVADGSIHPKNLTPDPVTGLGCWTDEQIINAVLAGVDEKGQELCGRMPRYGNRVDGGGAQQIVDFLRSLPAVNKAIPESTSCPPPVMPEAGTDADGGAPTDGGVDATTDTHDAADADAGAPTDGGVDADATIDVALPDAGPRDADAGSDAAVDATPDAAPDAGADTATDSDHDGATDAAPDAGTDATDADGATADADDDANG
jgi:hypothetical protein